MVLIMPKNKNKKASASKSDTKADSENQNAPEEEKNKEALQTLALLSTNMEQKIWDIAGKLWAKSVGIREKPPIDWVPYLENGFINQKEFTFVDAFQYTTTKDERDKLIDFYKDLTFKAIAKLVQNVHVVEDIEKFLVIIDDLLTEDMTRSQMFNEAIDEPWEAFHHLLDCTDEYIRNLGSRIMTKLMVGHRKKRPPPEKIEYFLDWLKIQLHEENEYMLSVGRCLLRLLQVDEYRKHFMDLNGVSQIIKLLSCGVKVQAQYLFSFCLWVTTFNPELAERLNQSGMIPILMDLLDRCPTEVTKLPRVVTATFRNLLEKPYDVKIRRNNALMMIQCKMLQTMDFFETRTDLSKDPEYLEDFNIVRDILNACVTELTSFDEYSLELKSSRLKWSVVHTSKRFWVENAECLNNNKYELLKILIDILESSTDATAVCIAAHDVGEYVKHYPRGKKVVEELGAKKAMVKLLSHKNPAIKFHALKSLQVMMLDHHEISGKEDDDKKSKGSEEKIGFGL